MPCKAAPLTREISARSLASGSFIEIYLAAAGCGADRLFGSSDCESRCVVSGFHFGEHLF